MSNKIKLNRRKRSQKISFKDNKNIDDFNYYKADVPCRGQVSYGQVQKLFDEGKTCRGWMIEGGVKEFFHIIKSPYNYPNKSLFFGESEDALFSSAVMMGSQNGIKLEHLFM